MLGWLQGAFKVMCDAERPINRMKCQYFAELAALYVTDKFGINLQL